MAGRAVAWMKIDLRENAYSWQFFVAFLGWLSDPFKWLSDLQQGDEKVTLNHLVSNQPHFCTLGPPTKRWHVLEVFNGK